MRTHARKGQPVAALLLVLALWAGGRAWLWESPFALLETLPTIPASGLVIASKVSSLRLTDAKVPAPPGASRVVTSGPVSVELPDRPVPLEFEPIAPWPVASGPQPAEPQRTIGGHQMLWMAAVAQLPMPPGLLAATPRPWPRSASAATPAPRRWSADGWLAWRRGGTGYNLPGGGLPGANLPVGTYGASQYGAVLRYRLDPSSHLAPALYLRATGSIDPPRYQEAALGLALRPIPAIPVAATAELRATRSFGETRLRPAAALVTELPPIKLPFAARAEAYLQVGYVGGKGATAFVDGQLRIDRAVTRLGPAELRAGAGAWGGAQEGARRLDIGPTVSLGLADDRAAARLSADWRFRVAGRAAPGSGPAITLSAGF